MEQIKKRKIEIINEIECLEKENEKNLIENSKKKEEFANKFKEIQHNLDSSKDIDIKSIVNEIKKEIVNLNNSNLLMNSYMSGEQYSLHYKNDNSLDYHLYGHLIAEKNPKLLVNRNLAVSYSKYNIYDVPFKKRLIFSFI